jgi:signal transduction histidine kinase
VLVNDKAEALLGGVFPAEQSPLLRSLRLGEAVAGEEIVHARGDGTSTTLLASSAPIRGPAGEITAAVATFVDITDRKLAQQAQAELLEAQRLESIGLLAGGVAHDFNNLLTGIMGNASLALDSLPRANPAYESVQRVIATGEQAAQLTRQLLAYAGKGSFVVQRIDISHAVAGIIDLIHASIPKKVALQLQLSAGLPPIEIDPGQLQQLVMNIAINAAEAIGEGASGSVAIRTRIERLDQGLPDLLPAGEYVCLEVLDNGCGMDERTKARIFEPFFSTKFLGRGLGLAAVAGIVRAQRGAIQVDSAPGRGTTFRVYLPGVPGASGAEAPGREEAAGAAQAVAGKILVVDDEEVVRSVARRALQNHGYDVLCAGDGEEAVRLFREHADSIRVVLLDLAMPVLNGDEVLPLLGNGRPDLKVIVSSGYSEAEAGRRFQGTGVAGFLQKPYTARQLVDKIRVLAQD